MVITGALMVVAFIGQPAMAHEGAESDRARDLVLQAIALIVNDPGNRAMIEDKVADALDANDTEGVELGLVSRAGDALTQRNLHRVRSLLERAIGARAHRGGGEPAPIREVGPPPRGAQPGRAIPSDSLPGREGFPVGDWALLAGSVVVAASGVALAIRWRPRRARRAS